MQLTRNQPYLYGYREFESPSLRHNPLYSLIKILVDSPQEGLFDLDRSFLAQVHSELRAQASRVFGKRRWEQEASLSG